MGRKNFLDMSIDLFTYQAPLPEKLIVRLTAKAAHNRIGEWIEVNGVRMLKVYVTAAPIKGASNAAMIELLAKEWGVAKSAITIVAGHTVKVKTLKITTA
jgi:uncharacterized protein YggU (UPF0235/DUF167 family)